MGLMADTNVFIGFEKSGRAIDLSPWEQSERMSILTDNVDAFSRVPGLRVIPFIP